MIKIRTENGRILRFVMICPDFDQVFYPILNAVRISPDFDQLSENSVASSVWIQIDTKNGQIVLQ